MLSMRSKRPWKKHAKIERIEFNSGDVKFEITYDLDEQTTSTQTPAAKRFESLDEAERLLDAWWADWWPKQVKSRRPA